MCSFSSVFFGLFLLQWTTYLLIMKYYANYEYKEILWFGESGIFLKANYVIISFCYYVIFCSISGDLTLLSIRAPCSNEAFYFLN